MKKLLTLLTSLALVFSLAGCGEKEKPVDPVNPGTTKYVVYTSSGYAPYEVINNETKKLEGFDIDLLEALSKELKFEYDLKDVDFNGIISGLQSGKADFAIAGMSPTPERLKNVDMTINYYDPSQGLEHVILSTSGLTENDLKGKKVGVQQGTIQETLLNMYKDELGYTVEPRTTYASIINEIKSGRIDAIVVEKPVGAELVAAHSDLKTVEFNKELDGANGNAIAFPKGTDKALLDSFNNAIKKFQEDGTMAALVEKWFSVEEEPTETGKYDLADGTYNGTAKADAGSSYTADINVVVTITGGNITDLTIEEANVTGTAFQKAIEPMKEAILAANGTEVDTVAGNTVTSNAIIEAVNNALTK